MEGIESQRHEEKNNAKDSYLATLGEDELGYVLRHLSNRPRNEDWHNYVSPNDVLSVLQSGGPLAASARSHFIHLNSGRMGLNINEHALFVKTTVEKDKPILEGLLSELAPTIQCIDFSCPNMQMELNILESCRRCVSLRSLHISRRVKLSYFRELLKACSGNLRELVILRPGLGPQSIEAMAEHCSGLKKFDISYGRGGMVSVWKTIGPSLEDLAIGLDTVNCTLSHLYDDVDEITSCCVKVHSLKFHSGSPGRWDDEYSALLVRFCEKFGLQLKSLNTMKHGYRLYREQIFKILDACPNLTVDICVGTRPNGLELFGDRVRALGIIGDCVPWFEQVGEAVPSLQKLTLKTSSSTASMKFLTLFFSTPKPHLKFLDIYFYNRRPSTEENPFDVIARLVTSLEVINVKSACLPPQEFQRIALANPGLKRVSVFLLYRQNSLTLPGIFGCIEAFSKCPILEELVIGTESPLRDLQRVAEACLAFRGRGVDIFISRRQYIC